MGKQAWGQGGNSETFFDIVIPAGGLNEDGTSAGLAVQEGDLLMSIVDNPIDMHAVVVDENANQVWSSHTPYRGFYMKPWRPGEFVWFDYTMRKWTVVDSDYNVLDTLTQSFEANDDYHDVQLLEDNSYLVVLLEEVFMDLTDMGGVENAKVLNPRLLHLDEDENVLREWSGLDHMPIDPLLDHVFNNTVHHLHWNAMQFDVHGGLLLSMRHRDQIVRLHPEDWSIHWKLGGWMVILSSTTPSGTDFALNMTSTIWERDAFCCSTTAPSIKKDFFRGRWKLNWTRLHSRPRMFGNSPTLRASMPRLRGVPFDWTTATH